MRVMLSALHGISLYNDDTFAPIMCLHDKSKDYNRMKIIKLFNEFRESTDFYIVDTCLDTEELKALGFRCEIK